jgi:hypothetical protein
VACVEHESPEAEHRLCDHLSVSFWDTAPTRAPACVGHEVRQVGVQWHGWVVPPRSIAADDRPVILAQLGVERVAKEHLELSDGAMHRRRRLDVPLVQVEREDRVTLRRGDVPVESGWREPRSQQLYVWQAG